MEVRTILHTMLFNIVDAILQVYGFDTYYGVFHKCFYMRKSLVCDLMEPIRPVVDYQVRKSINLGQCKENDFEVINNRWCLKYKSNPKYRNLLLSFSPLMNYKHRIQYSVFEIDNSTRILDNIISDLKNKYEKRFSQEDSVMIFKLSSSCEVLRFGYAKNDEKDFIIIT